MRELAVLTLLAQQRATATVTGSEVDLGNYAHVGGREMKAILAIDSLGTDTDETCNVKIQESETTVTGDFTDISGAAFTAYAQESAALVEEIHFVAKKRYIRALATIAGTTPAFDFACVALANERHAS